jgi:multicopper oxidase
MRIIVYNTFVPVGHPMHLHGHEFQVLAEGFGSWDGTITNPSNPMRRDVQFLQPASPTAGRSFTVLQVTLDNPTINIFHCHLYVFLYRGLLFLHLTSYRAWHVSGGLYVAFLERPDLIPQHQIPDSVTDSCEKWNAFTKTNVPDQIDSGV